MRILVTRPREDAQPLIEKLRRLGAEAVAEPLLRIVARNDAPLDLTEAQALLITSANGLRAFAERSPRRDLPIYAVGDGSARAARAAGFATVESAAGDVEALAQLVKQRIDPAKGALLHVAGSDLAGDLGGRLTEAGYVYRRAVLYRAETAEAFSPETVEAIGAGQLQGAAFFSPRTAATFAKLIRQAGLQSHLTRMTAFCLSPAVADKFSDLGWGRIAIAQKPDQDSLLETVAEVLDKGEAMHDKPMGAPQDVEATPDVVPVTEIVPPSDQSQPPDAPPRKRRSVWTLAVGLVVLGVLAWGAQVWLLPKVVPERRASATDVQTAPPVSQPNPPAALAAPDPEKLRLQKEVEALHGRLAALERLLGEIQSSLTGPAVTGHGDGIALDALAQRLAKLEALDRSANTAGEALAQLDRRLGALEKAEVDPSRRAPAVVVAVGQLREAVRAGAPYGQELAVLKALAEGDGEILGALGALAGGAGTGVPSRQSLRQRFDPVGLAVIKAAAGEGGDGWLDKTGRRLTALVTIRKTGVETAGTGPEAAVGRAEVRLEAGDLAGAVEALGGLGGAAAKAAAPWLAQANQRLGAERSLAALQARALALLGRKG